MPYFINGVAQDDVDERWRMIVENQTMTCDELKQIAKAMGLHKKWPKKKVDQKRRILSASDFSEEHAQERGLYDREWETTPRDGRPNWYVHDEDGYEVGSESFEEAKRLANDYPWCSGITTTSDGRRFRRRVFKYYLKTGPIEPSYKTIDQTWLKI
jgi:hypothetical protein